MVPRDRVRNQPKQGASCVVCPKQQNSRTGQCQWSLPTEKSYNARTVSDTLGYTSTECSRTRYRSISTRVQLWSVDAMAAKGIEQRRLLLLHQCVILCVIDYSLGLTTLSQSNLLKLDRAKMEPWGPFWEQQKIRSLKPWATCWPSQDMR